MKQTAGALLVVLCAMFAACQATPRTESHGKENIAYLQIASHSAYTTSLDEEGTESLDVRTVTVIIDGLEPFTAVVNDSAKRTVKNAHSYKIAVGAHDIEILSEGTSILRKKIFASANEVKVVEIQ